MTKIHIEPYYKYAYTIFRTNQIKFFPSQISINWKIVHLFEVS